MHELIDNLKTDSSVLKHDPRFTIVTDFETLLAIDRKTADGLDIPIAAIAKHYDFFLPWAGMEKKQHQGDNPADIKAAYRMAKLYDEIKKDNPTTTSEEVHNLNVFLSRLLFCFFAEDTGILKKDQFTNAISSHTQADGSDLHTYLDTLFTVMNTEPGNRRNLPQFLQAFDYVNGGLFSKPHYAPSFTRLSRKTIIECGELNWSDINPDIFGSMIQAVVTPEHRGGLGMHYTSVPNIMKVIEPLFLNELIEELEAARNEPRKLNKLLERIGKLKIFDPACGSGNFLIIAYKQLRLLEMQILQQLQLLQKAATGFQPKQMELIPKAQLNLAAQFQVELFTRVQLSHFYGIEIDDFAHEIAMLSLWLAEHQMNTKFKEVFGVPVTPLPLKPGGNITHSNATHIDWETVCPKQDGDEIYILGNPPYKGFSQQEKIQKEDLKLLLNGKTKLDYISCWFIKGAKFIQNHSAQFAFVSTNSISQGEQVNLLWPNILRFNLEIGFAHQSFKWVNNAKANAGVTCVIIGIRNTSSKSKSIFKGKTISVAKNINPYLLNEKTIYIEKRSRPLSDFPLMVLGNMPYDTGLLHFTDSEYNNLVDEYPSATNFLRRIVGSQEFINDIYRYCLWISDKQINGAVQISVIKNRIEENELQRSISIDVGVRKLASKPHQFREMREAEVSTLVFPGTSSERRQYIPMGFVNKDVVVNNLAFAIYDAEIFLLGICSSKMHMAWIKVVCGSLETRIRYSSVLGYNTFPFPPINQTQKQELEKHVYRILEERENHSEKTLAQLYDPDKMPPGLREAHHQNDLAVERCYRSRPFESDEERLEYLFKLYEQMIAEEKTRGTLFEAEAKAKKKKQ